ncbi:hypothetical protein [Acidithiobacillus sulfurivorans]|uniref:Uncharacterized protein n=1 Tax=Acidithiobacillus sulfurivorans TaxID=1958756 RepID=A0ABS6A2N1_9PROT|nr:hypothetical protein [Acidithiobacillus sulfurivorans]MBU2761466.1 hypothetical protein [Acidithiobacillus sulfurivorans]
MTTREFFLSATFTAGLIFVVSLVVLGIVYGPVTPLFYVVSAGLLVSPFSLLFKKRKIVLPIILGVNYEYQLSTVIQWFAVTIIFPVTTFSARTTMQAYASGLFFILYMLVFLSLQATRIRIKDEENYTSFYKK